MDDEYLNLLRLFHAEGVGYVIIGGCAMRAHGLTLPTKIDLELWVNPTPANSRRAAHALCSYYEEDAEFLASLEQELTAVPCFLPFGLGGAWLFIVTQPKADLPFETAAMDALTVELGNVPVHFASLATIRLVSSILD